MPRLALALCVTLVAAVVVLRLVLHRRRHGAGAFVGLRSGNPRWERFNGALLSAGALLLAASWSLMAADCLEPLFAHPLAAVAGALLWAGGLLLAWRAQEAMGASFRIGVDPREAPPLVTGGPFARVRNPIYAALLAALLGLSLIAPHALAAAGWVAVAGAFRLQVVQVEEPHLARSHGAAWAAYAAWAGRFLPGIGRVRVGSPRSPHST